MNRFFQVRILGALLIALALMVTISVNSAMADYPKRPINLIVGFKAGGYTDLAARTLAIELRKVLGKPVVIVNKPGAASIIAARFVAGARPDGYTLWFGSAGTLVLKRELGQSDVDFFEDFKLAGFSGQLVPALAVPNDRPYKSIQDIIDAAKAKPGVLRWGHNGRGSAFMAAGVGFIVANGLDVQEVPFSGGKGSRQALFGNQVDFGMVNAADRIKFGTKMRVLAAFRNTREDILDDQLPTMGEQDVKFISVDSPVGILAPKGVSDDIMVKLENAINEAVSQKSYKEAMDKIIMPATFFNQADGTAYVSKIRDNVREILPHLK